MDVSTENFETMKTRPASFLVVVQTARNMYKKLVDFFTFTKEDLEKAGVYFNEEDRNG